MYPRIGPGPTREGRHNGLGSCAEESVEWTIEPCGGNIGSHGRKSILVQSDKQRDCAIFRASDRLRGGNRWNGLWATRITTSARVITSARRATRSPICWSFTVAWAKPRAALRD